MNKIDPFERFNKDWALVTAGTPEHFNSMTISWGSMGTIWGKSIVTIYIRPDRYTWSFLKESDAFTVSFYPEECRGALLKMGTLSGRDTDKAAASGLTPQILEEGVTYAEASETFVCRKIYMAQMKYEDVPDAAKKIYQNGIEPHYIIMGEVIRHETAD
jgi:flavin reductase (DIM6/NTAB) family NADH-FMN oxidoreductase RutF